MYPCEYWNRELDLPSEGLVRGVPRDELEFVCSGQLRWYRFTTTACPGSGLLLDEGWGLTAEPEDADHTTYTVRWDRPAWADPPWSAMPPLPASMPCDTDGRPLNPLRTNTMPHGRGLLGKWGPNRAVDVLLTAVFGGEVHVLVVKRRDTAQYAFVGGMCATGTHPLVQGLQELREEALSKLTPAQGAYLETCLANYVHLCDEPMKDPRNTRHAWMEVTAFHIHIPDEHMARALELQPAEHEDATEARWARVGNRKLWPTTAHGGALDMYADHLKYLPLLRQSPLFPAPCRGRLLLLCLLLLMLTWMLLLR